MLLLYVLDWLDEGHPTTELITLEQLAEPFQMYWKSIPGLEERAGNLVVPFFHLRYEGFWHLEPVPGLAQTVEIVPSARAATTAEGDLAWTLTLGSKKISTRFCSVQISGQSQGLFDAVSALPRVRVEIREGKAVLSTPIAATYGLSEATHDVQLAFADEASHILAPNTVTLLLTQEPSQPTARVSIHVLDAVTGRELARLEPVELTITI